MEIKRNGFVLAGAALGTAAFLIIALTYWSNMPVYEYGPSSNIMSTSLITQLALLALATAFAWSGYGAKVRGPVLIAGILFSVSVVFYFINIFFLAMPIIFCFIGYAKMNPTPKPDIAADFKAHSSSKNELTIRRNANMWAKYVLDTANAIKGTVGIVVSLAKDGYCDQSIADEGISLMSTALDVSQQALAIAQSEDISRIDADIEVAKQQIQELHAQSLKLLDKAKCVVFE